MRAYGLRDPYARVYTRNIGALTLRLQVLRVWVWPINLGKEKRSIHRSTMTDGIMFGKLRRHNVWQAQVVLINLHIAAVWKL